MDIFNSIITGIIALNTGVLGWFSYSLNKRSQQEALEASRLSRETEVKTWIKDVFSAYEMMESKEIETEQAGATKISSLMDYGRIFFPNDSDAEAYRSNVLDPLGATLKAEPSDREDKIQNLRKHRRKFVKVFSEMQYITAFAENSSPEAIGVEQYNNREPQQ